MRTDSDRYMSAYADPSPAHKTRNRVLIISAHPGLKVSGLLRIISVPGQNPRTILIVLSDPWHARRCSLSNLPVASPFSSSTDLIAHTLFKCGMSHSSRDVSSWHTSPDRYRFLQHIQLYPWRIVARWYEFTTCDEYIVTSLEISTISRYHECNGLYIFHYYHT